MASSIEIPEPNAVLGRAVRFLIEGGEDEAAALLLACDLSIGVDRIHEPGDLPTSVMADCVYYVSGPRRAYEVVTQFNRGWGFARIEGEQAQHHFELGQQMNEALWAVTPREVVNVMRIEPSFDHTPPPPDWREDVATYILGADVHNQAPGDPAQGIRMWNNLRFRSESELRIAQALDNVGALFFPNSRCRATENLNRILREPDFLVCWKGKWGILEVDGEPFHPPSRTVHDHARDRIFKAHGVSVVEHFDASECFENSDGVVKKFLGLIEGS